MEDDPWAEYVRLSAILDRTTDASRDAGIEEARRELLEKIANGETVSRPQIDYLTGNRISKQRRRRAIVARHKEDIVGVEVAEEWIESRLILERCAELCGADDFQLIVCRALGFTYREISIASGRNENSLKTRVYRARSLVQSLAA